MKEDFDSSDSNNSNGAYADFTITNLEDCFSSLFDVVNNVADPLFEHFSNPQEFLADLDATRKMQSQFQRVPYADNFVLMIHIIGSLVRNPSNIHKTCSQFWETLLAFIATFKNMKCLDEVVGLPQWDEIDNSDLDFIGFKMKSMSCMHHKSCMHNKCHMQIIMHASHIMHVHHA